jgi:hypothetical protein
MAEHWNGGNGGKGSAPRPFSIAQDEYAKRWDAIFQRDLPKEEEDKITRYNEETQEVKSKE